MRRGGGRWLLWQLAIGDSVGDGVGVVGVVLRRVPDGVASAADAARRLIDARHCAVLRRRPLRTFMASRARPAPRSKAAHDESICRQPTQHLFI
jgi:hypothetical protein